MTTPRYLPKRPTSNLTNLLRRQDKWIELEAGPVIRTPAILGNNFRVLLTEDCNVDPPHDPHPGQFVRWRFEQPTGGGITVTFNASKFVTVMDLPVPVSEVGGAVSYVEAIYNDDIKVWEIQGVQGLASSQITTVTEINSNTTLTANNHVVFVDTSSSDITVTLPAGVDGTEYIIKKYRTPNSVIIETTGSEKVFGAESFTLDAAEEVVTLIFYSDEWEVINHHEWNLVLSSTPSFPVMMAEDSLGTISADEWTGFGTSEIIKHSSASRYETIAPIDGTISAFRAEISGGAVGAGEQWDFTLYVNDVATALTCSIAEAETADSDLVNSISVSRGDRLSIFIDETGTLSNNVAFSFVYTSVYQPMFGNGNPSVTRYGDIQCAQHNNSGNRHIGSLFPCAGSLTNFYLYGPDLNASGEEITATLCKWNSGTSSWDDTALVLTLNFNSDGATKSDTSSYAVSAGDYLQWKYEDTGSGTPGYLKVSAQFIPAATGDVVVTGTLSTYSEADADTFSMPMGAEIDDFADNTKVGSNISAPLTGTLSDLYVALPDGPGSPNKWIQVALTKDGVATDLAAKVGDPAVAASDTSDTVSVTAGTHDIGINITNSGDTPDPKSWVAWGFKYNPVGSGDDITYVPVGDSRITSVSSSYSALDTDEMVLCDTTSGDITVTLPAAVDGRKYTIKKIASANSVTIAPQSTELIDGDTTKVLTTGNDSVTLTGYSGDWYIK